MLPINLDNNATTQPSPGVVEAMAGVLRENWHNPSSVHRGGQAARQAVELARQQVAELIRAKPRDIVFASGGTEAIDLAIRGVLGAMSGATAPRTRPRNIVTTKVEHSAVRDLVEELARTNAVEVRWADLDDGGILGPKTLAMHLDADTALVCVQWANNETGAIQPVAALHSECKQRIIPMLCDGTQWVGKMPTDVSAGAAGDAPFELLTFSPHKFHGPKGVGVLWARRGLRMRPTIHGTQELGRRGGTENVPGIVGAGVAAEEARAWLADSGLRVAQAALRDRFERAVLAAIPEARVNGPADPASVSLDARTRLWNTTNIAFPRLEAEALLLLLSERGLYASAGAACSSGSLDPSPVLLAMGVAPELAHGSLRFSLSKHTTLDEVDRAVEIVLGAVRTLRGSSSSVG